MKRIPLTRGQFALVSDEDFEWMNQHTWQINSTGYAARTSRDPQGKKRMILLHRELLGAKPGEEVDHINGHRTDCRRENLRISTRGLNIHNQPAYARSGFKGVYFDPRKKLQKPWWGLVTVNGRRISVGYFSSAEEAARAVDSKRRELTGNASWFNFPDKQHKQNNT